MWVDFEQRDISVCPFCGAYTRRSLQIRNGEAGRVRFFAQNGLVLPKLTDAQVMDIFGVTADTVPTCSFRTTAGCYSFTRTHNDRVLRTTPPAMITHAAWTSAVPTPNGSYWIFWATSSETDSQFNMNCADGPGIATDNGFIAVLTAP